MKDSRDKIGQDLSAWYLKNSRPLPWRKDKNPYRVWISEIMLQQTRVETVIPYFEKFTKKFPNVKSLANAKQEEVLKLWAGLGYYSRAKNLHKGAQEILKRFGKTFPQTIEDLRSIPGIGPYTANAIASICFNTKVPAIDANLERVISRLLDLRADPKTNGRLAIEELGHAILRNQDAGIINQAFMDLSSQVCALKNPKCTICPVATFCESRKNGSTDLVPLRKTKEKLQNLKTQGIVVVHENKFLLGKRKPKTWLSGMWDIPWAVESDFPKLKQKSWKKFARLETKRTITKYKIDFTVDCFAVKSKTLPSIKQCAELASEWRWQSIESLDFSTLPRPTQKLLRSAIAELKKIS